MRLMARTANGYPVALGFRGQLATGRDGDPPDRLDLKRGAIIPLVNLVRFHALAHGVTISPTLDRIEAVANVGDWSATSPTDSARPGRWSPACGSSTTRRRSPRAAPPTT